MRLLGDDLLVEEERAAYAYENERAELVAEDSRFEAEHEKAKSALDRARQALAAHDETGRELHRRIIELAQEKSHVEADVARFEGRTRELVLMAEELDRIKAETVAIGGVAVVSYLPLEKLTTEERKTQEDRKRSLERLQIRLEEAGGTGEDIRTEHKEVAEREQFLGRELDDLAKSAAGLRSLIEDLNTELAKHFTEGLKKVNESFGEFFALMFGGGGARLTLEEFDEPEEDESSFEEEEVEKEDVPKEMQRPGMEITVNLPKKRVQSLMQLSGGERALTSIALIFAMSQVNPPPFLILDETDAALDEANSRRYGDMIENLAQKSQLIVITHNRETMSRAGILYGVTMGDDGVSKLLSVKFEEAVAVAK
jgi:chromosome segregation protein